MVGTDTKELADRLSDASSTVVKFVDGRRLAVENGVRALRDVRTSPHPCCTFTDPPFQVLSNPSGLIPAAIGIEELALYIHVASFGHKVVHFPPLSTDRGSMASLLRAIFFWAPSVSWRFSYPQLSSFSSSSEFWPALTWWFFATVLPPMALSSLVSFIPQKGAHRGGATTRYQGECKDVAPATCVDLSHSRRPQLTRLSHSLAPAHADL